MKRIVMSVLCTVCVLGTGTISRAVVPHDAETQAIRRTLEELKQVYSAELVMGTPMEVNGLKILPVATVGVGYGEHDLEGMNANGRGVGGVLNPVGIIVVSGEDVKLVQFSKSVMAEAIEILVPLALQALNMPVAEERGAPEKVQYQPPPQKPGVAPQIAAAYYRFVILLFVVWLAVALLLETFWPQKLDVIRSTLKQNPLRAGYIGLIGYGAAFLGTVVFAVTLVGIPLSLILMILTAVFTLFGSFGIAVLTGQKIVRAFEKSASDLTYLVLGGILLGILGMIPVLGWLLLAVVGMLSFGVIVQIQWDKVKKD